MEIACHIYVSHSKMFKTQDKKIDSNLNLVNMADARTCLIHDIVF